MRNRHQKGEVKPNRGPHLPKDSLLVSKPNVPRKEKGMSPLPISSDNIYYRPKAHKRSPKKKEKENTLNQR